MIIIRFHDQTRFGGNDAPPNERGNCDKTCLATLIGCDPSEIPNYQELMGDDWWKARNRFLNSRGFHVVTFNGLVGTPGGICVAVGKSPRGDWSHAVVASVTHGEEGPRIDLLHDPHPSREFIVGNPTEFDFVFRITKYQDPQPAIAALVELAA